MLLSLIHLKGRQLKTHEGALGRINDFYFDDQERVIRFFVIDSGACFSSQFIYVSPVHFNGKTTGGKENVLHDNRMRKDRERILPDKITSPKSLEHFKHFYHWPELVKTHPEKPPINGVFYENQNDSELEEEQKCYHSIDEMMSYQIRALDGDVGHITDLIVDDDSWKIFFVVIETMELFSSNEVLIEMSGIKKIHWESCEILIDMTRDQIVHQPGYPA